MQSYRFEQRGAAIRRRGRISGRLVLLVGLLLASSQLLSQEGKGRHGCNLSGTWYGGSVVAYHMTIIPSSPAGHYIVFAEGMYKNSVMNTTYTGKVEKKGELYVGPLMQLATSDPDFLNPPPIGKMPDLNVVWSEMEMVDCNTIKNTIPFFGYYFASNLWQPGIVWNMNGKVPLFDVPDVDLLDVLTGGAPILETYHRIAESVNPKLLHKN
jgi:hypothetical protein